MESTVCGQSDAEKKQAICQITSSLQRMESITIECGNRANEKEGRDC